MDQQKTKTKQPKRVGKKKKMKNELLTKLEAERPVILIKRNLFGQYEHLETGIIFDEHSKKILGIREGAGEIRSLRTEEIELILKKYPYFVFNNNGTCL